MKKVVVLTVALFLSVFGFTQTKEMNLNSSLADLNSSTFDFDVSTESDFSFSSFELETKTNATLDEPAYGWNRGDWNTSLKFGYSTSTFGDEKDNSFSLVPCFGTFITDNWELGGELGYKSSKLEFDGDDLEKTSTIKAGVYGRYFCEPQQRFSTFVGGHINYRSMKFDVQDYKETGFGVSVDLGFNYFLNDRWVLNSSIGALGYETSKPDFDGAESQNTFYTALNLKRARFGIGYRFGGSRIQAQ